MKLTLDEHWPEMIFSVVFLICAFIVLTSPNPIAGYISVGIIAFYFGGLYTLYRDSEPLWPILLIGIGAFLGVLTGGLFSRRLLVLIWYLAILFVSIYAFDNNWVQRFKRERWLK